MRNFNTLIISLLIVLIFEIILHGQQEKVGNWNPSTGSFISNKSLMNFDNNTINKELSDSIWHSIGPSNNDILRFDFGNNNPDIIYAASRDSGVFKSINGGIDWNQINNGITDDFIRSIAVHPQNGNIILVGTFSTGLYRTIDGGQTWTFIDQVDDLTILDITFDRQHGDTVYVGTISKGVYRSWNAGTTWQHLSPDSITTYALEVIVDPQFTNIIYYSDKQRVYKSTDYGNTWNLFFEGLILGLAVDPWDSNIIYMGGFNGSIFKTSDGGQTWQLFSINGYPQVVEDVLIDFNNTNNVYIATVFEGVFRSTNSGYTWSELNGGITTEEVLELKFHPLTTSSIYAATNGSAIIKIENLITSISKIENYYPKDILLFQNYPNPFNPKTTIKYSIPQNDFIKLTVYDILGKVIKTLVNEEKPAGEYAVNFDASKLSSGVYLYKLQAGSYTQVKKLILLK